MNEKYYNIHNLLTFKVIEETAFPYNLFNSIYCEYQNFECPPVSNPDFTVYLGDFFPSNQECFILDNKYYVKKDYFYCEDSYKFTRWKLEISGFEGQNMTLRISTNIFANMVVSGFLMDPLINFKLTQKGYSLIHGSCISKNNQAYLFTAQGGGGKTSTSLYAIEKGFNFLGDNFIILNKGHALNFPAPLNIFSFNLNPIVEKNMTVKSKFEFHLKNILYLVSKLRIVTKINIKEILPDSLAVTSKLKSILLLIPKDDFSSQQVDKYKIIDHMVANMRLDSFPFIKYMMEYSYAFPESTVSNHWKLYEKNLYLNITEDLFFYEIEVPQKYTLSTFNKILRVIQSATNP